MPFSSEARCLLLILAVSCPKIENNSNSDEYCQDGFSNGNVNTLRSSSSRVFSLGFVMVGRSFLLIGIEKGTVDFSAVPCGIFSFGVNYLSTNTSSPQMIDDTTFTTSSASICSATI